MIKCDPYALACMPAKHYCFGLELKDLSLGHVLTFQREGLPYFSEEGTTVSFPDFLTSVFICSLTYTELQALKNEKPYTFWSVYNFKHLFKPWYFTKYKGTPLMYQVYQWSMNFKKSIGKDFTLHEEMVKFNKYLETAKNEPNVLTNTDRDTSPSNAPWVLGIKNVLTAEVGLNELTVMEMPYSKCIWEFFKYVESQGGVEFFKVEEVLASGMITKLV